MRHVYIRSILACIWLVAAIFSAISGLLPMAGLYLILTGVFYSSAHSMWKKEKEDKETDKK